MSSLPLAPVSSFAAVAYYSASPHTSRLHDPDGNIVVEAPPLPKELRAIFDCKETPLSLEEGEHSVVPGVRTVARPSCTWEPPSPELREAFWAHVNPEGSSSSEFLVRVFVSAMTADAAAAAGGGGGKRIQEALGDNVDVLLAYTGRQPGHVKYDEKGQVFSTGAVSFVSPVRPL